MNAEEVKKLQEALSGQVKEGLKTTDEAVAELKKAVKELREEAEKQAQKNAISVPGVESSKFSFAKCLSVVKEGKSLSDMEGYEGDVIRETQKAQTVSPSTAGGVFVPTEVSSKIIELALAQTVLDKLPIEKINVQGNNRLTIPTITADPTASWLGELDSIPESSMAFGSVDIEPWKVGAFVSASNEILSQKEANMESLVKNQMARQLALAIDIAGFTGTGSANKMPLGILNTPGILSYTKGGANGDSPDWETYDALQGLLESNNTFQGGLAYVSRPEVNRRLRNQTISQFSGDTGGQPLFGVPFMSQAQLDSMVGYPVKGTTQLPISVTGTNNTAPLVFGDFTQLLLAMYGNIEISSDTSVLFQKYGTVMRAIARMDLKVLRPKSFAVAPTVEFKAV